MSLINNLFNNKKIECPRCLGKGNVVWDDIKRLKKGLKWVPGPCAYCDNSGKVNSKLPSKIAVDTSYLTIDLSPEERKKVIANDKDARQRALYHDIQTDNFISEVAYLHFTGNIDAIKIANFYLLHEAKSKIDSNNKEELIDYINSIISQKKEN